MPDVSAATNVAKAVTSKGGAAGLGFGVLGLGAAAYTVITGTFDKDPSLKSTFLTGPMPMATGAGLGFLLLANQEGLKGTGTQRLIKGAALALIAGGLIGGILGLVPNIFPNSSSSPVKTFRQPNLLPRTIPNKVADLEGITLANAFVQMADETSSRNQYGVYVSTKTAKKLGSSTVENALNEAVSLVKADESKRAQAILKTQDGTLWAAQLTGDVDQIDGQFYTKDNKFDVNAQPIIDPSHPALMGVAGVEHVYDYDLSPKITAASPQTGATS